MSPGKALLLLCLSESASLIPPRNTITLTCRDRNTLIFMSIILQNAICRRERFIIFWKYISKVAESAGLYWFLQYFSHGFRYFYNGFVVGYLWTFYINIWMIFQKYSLHIFETLNKWNFTHMHIYSAFFHSAMYLLQKCSQEFIKLQQSQSSYKCSCSINYNKLTSLCLKFYLTPKQ